MASFTIIIPTAGTRDSLAGTLASLVGQLQPGDEIIVACNRDENYGDKAIDSAQARAAGSHVLYCDDDDVYLPGALAEIREWADANPSTVGIFRRTFPNHAKQWRVPVLRPGNVQRMGFCIPNVPGRMPTWTGYETEADIVREASATQGVPLVFVDSVIGLARPFEATPWKRMRYALRIRTRLRILRGADEADALRA